MAQKLSRRDLKRNELAETVGKTVDYVSHHRRGATEIVAIAAGVVLLVAGFFLVRSYRERAAGTALSAGLAALETPLASEPAATGAPKTYPTAAERTREAETHLKKAASYGGTVAGRAAKVVLTDSPPEKARVYGIKESRACSPALRLMDLGFGPRYCRVTLLLSLTNLRRPISLRRPNASTT